MPRCPTLHGAGPPDPRRGARHPGHVLAEGVHPAHDAVPRPVRLLHVRPAAGPRSSRRTSTPDEVLAIAARGRRRRLPRGAVHPRRGPEERYPVAARVARRARLRLDRRLPRRRWRGWCSTRPACSPTPTPARCTADELARLRAVAPSQGMMIESLARRPRLPPRRARQDARAPAGHARGRRRAARSRSPPASSSASARPRADRLDALEAIADAHRAPRPRAGGDRPELPARSRAPRCTAPPPCPTDEFLVAIAAGPPDPARRRPPPGAAEPLRRLRRRCSTPASTTGAASRRSPPTT